MSWTNCLDFGNFEVTVWVWLSVRFGYCSILDKVWWFRIKFRVLIMYWADDFGFGNWRLDMDMSQVWYCIHIETGFGARDQV